MSTVTQYQIADPFAAFIFTFYWAGNAVPLVALVKPAGLILGLSYRKAFIFFQLMSAVSLPI